MRRTYGLLFLAYVGFLLALTFYPFDGFAGNEPVDLRLQAFRTINFALRKGLGSSQFLVLVGNLVAFVPLGLLLPVVLNRRSLALVVLAGLGLSVAIEAGQLAISMYLGFAFRTADIDDVIVNVLGAVVGYYMLLVVDGLRSWADARRPARPSSL